MVGNKSTNENGHEKPSTTTLPSFRELCQSLRLAPNSYGHNQGQPPLPTSSSIFMEPSYTLVAAPQPPLTYPSLVVKESTSASSQPTAPTTYKISVQRTGRGAYSWEVEPRSISTASPPIASKIKGGGNKRKLKEDNNPRRYIVRTDPQTVSFAPLGPDWSQRVTNEIKNAFTISGQPPAPVIQPHPKPG